MDTHTFSGYRMRPANPDDRFIAEAWTDADPHHRTTTPAGFWLEQGAGRDAYLLFDGAGPVFFFKMDALPGRDGRRAGVEFHLQFMPTESDEDRERVRTALQQGLAWIEGELRRAGIGYIATSTTSRPLAAFCRKRLGFAQEGTGLRKAL